jgi:hypothetical protein
MKLVHGSPFKIEKNDSFKLFDSQIDRNSAVPAHLNNGKDQYGPGIYTFPGAPSVLTESIREASCYTKRDDDKSNNDGYIYILSVDLKESEFLNKRSSDEIDEETWVNIIEKYMEIRCAQEGYSESDLHEYLESFADNINNEITFDHNELESQLKKKFDISLEYIDPNTFSGNGSDWINAVIEEYRLNNYPCSSIDDEGGPYAIANYAINSHDNLWAAIVSVWEACAVKSDGVNAESYNNTFLQAVKYHMPDDAKIVASKVNNGGIIVVFDPSAITITKTIDLSTDNSAENNKINNN